MKLVTRFLCLSLLLMAVVFVSSLSWADAIPVTGNTNWASDISWQINFSGSGPEGSIDVHSDTRDANSGNGCGTPGTLCRITIPAAGNFGTSYGTLNNVEANFLGGDLQFSFIVPTIPLGGFTVTAPGTVSGAIDGYDFVTGVGVTAFLWEVTVSGKGMAYEIGFNDGLGFVVVHNAGIDFTGTATPVPEPQSLALMGVGLLGFAGVLRRKLML